jgi:hypothetical protein
MKHLQTYVSNTWKYLKHMLATCMYMQHPDVLLQHPDKILATYVWNKWNIWNKHLKHTCIAIITCATSWSTFATSIYNTCNIPLKHLKHIFATCNFPFFFFCTTQLTDEDPMGSLVGRLLGIILGRPKVCLKTGTRWHGLQVLMDWPGRIFRKNSLCNRTRTLQL